jgi:hypothetical protein
MVVPDRHYAGNLLFLALCIHEKVDYETYGVRKLNRIRRGLSGPLPLQPTPQPATSYALSTALVKSFSCSGAENLIFTACGIAPLYIKSTKSSSFDGIGQFDTGKSAKVVAGEEFCGFANLAKTFYKKLDFSRA